MGPSYIGIAHLQEGQKVIAKEDCWKHFGGLPGISLRSEVAVTEGIYPLNLAEMML